MSNKKEDCPRYERGGHVSSSHEEVDHLVPYKTGVIITVGKVPINVSVNILFSYIVGTLW